VADAGLSDSDNSGADSSDADTGADNSADIGEDTSGDESSEVTEDTGDSSEVSADTSEDTSEEPAAEPAEEEPIVEELSQLDKDLADLGIKAPKPGERENRLPHSRVKKIAENYGKKVEARFTGEISNLKAQVGRLSKAAQTLTSIDKLLDSGEGGVDRFMTMLSTVHPGKFDKYLGNAKGAPTTGKAAKVVGSAAESTIGPRPQPDVVFDDKSRGYSPEQHDKLLQWVSDSAAERARADAITEMEARMEAKYGPMYKQHEQQAAFNEELPRVQAVVQGIHETWGKELVEKHEDAIVALMQQYPDMPTAEATARILVPLVRADRNKMRTGLIKETKTRTAAAAKVVPGGAAKDTNEATTIDDVIRQSIRKAGLK
jgi:hypothetical protein